MAGGYGRLTEIGDGTKVKGWCACPDLFPSRAGAVALEAWEGVALRDSVVLNTTANALRSLLAGRGQLRFGLRTSSLRRWAVHNISVNRTSRRASPTSRCGTFDVRLHKWRSRRACTATSMHRVSGANGNILAELRLTGYGTLRSLARQGLRLSEGMRLVFSKQET